MANIEKWHYQYQKPHARKCGGKLIRLYNRVTIPPANYGLKTKQKFEAFGFICSTCEKIIFDEDIKNKFEYFHNHRRI